MAYAPAMNLGPLQSLTTGVIVVSAYDPASTPTTYNISMAAFVPVGAKAVYVDGYCQSTAAGDYFQYKKTGAASGYNLGQDCQVANQNIHLMGTISLDANRTFDAYFSNARISGFNLTVLGYYMGG